MDAVRMESESEIDLIEQVLNQFSQALTDHDVEAITDSYIEGSVMYSLAPPLQGRSDPSRPAGEAIEEWLDSWTDGPHYQSKERKTIQNGSLAVSYCLLHMMGERKDGIKTDLWFRDTTVLQKVAGRWKIPHQHESVPMLMDGSEKAAVDLKPELH